MKEKRSEYYQKAAFAFKRKQGGVAAYYSEEGRRVTENLKMMEETFKKQTFENRNRLAKLSLVFIVYVALGKKARSGLSDLLETINELPRISQASILKS